VRVDLFLEGPIASKYLDVVIQHRRDVIMASYWWWRKDALTRWAARSCKWLGVYNEGCLQSAEAALIFFYF